MSNDSSTGGYLQPAPQFPAVPGGVTFTQFLQSVFAGISGIDPTLVRPKWQPNAPKRPSNDQNWLALAVVGDEADANAWVGSVLDGHGNTINTTQRFVELEIQCSFYGPQSKEYMDLTRDGFQVPQNRFVMEAGGLGFFKTDKGHRVPDLLNEVWVDRWEMTYFIRQEILRSYPILTFASASGTIQAIVSGNLKIVDWNTKL